MRSRWILVALSTLIILAAWMLVGILRQRTVLPPEISTRAADARIETPDSADPSSQTLDPVVHPESSSQQSSAPSPEARRPEGNWIRGRVRIPEGTPAEDRIEVVARYWDLEGSPSPSAPVAADGSFLIRFPSEVDSGALEIRSRFLYLESEFSVDLDAPAADVVLEPMLGGCITGRIVPPRGYSAEDPDLASARVELAVPEVRSVGLKDDLRFEITQVPDGKHRVLRLVTDAFLFSETPLDVHAGSVADVEIPVRVGVRVSGRVVDWGGRALSGARVYTNASRVRSSVSARNRLPCDERSEVDGTFRLKSIPPGHITMLVEDSRCLPVTLDLGDLNEGQVREGLEIRLDSGLIGGRVEWPDGSPAAGCSIDLLAASVGRAGSWFFSLSHHGLKTSDDGGFSISVTQDGSYHLNARSAGWNESPFGSVPHRGPCGVAMVDGLRPGQEPIVVVLTSGNGIHGRVVDDVGQPLNTFFVHGSMYREDVGIDLLDDVSSRFDDSDGEFEMPCLPSGRWVFTANADGRNGPTSEPLTLPGDASQLVLVVPRGAALSGLVLDPSGAPVSYGQVCTSSRSSCATADASGRFRLTSVEPGEFDLWATSADSAPSQRVRISSSPGQSIEDLVLILRVGGRIIGEALDGEGQPDAGRKVKVFNEELGAIPEATSDASGTFEFHGLAPGRYSICREANEDELSSSEEPGASPWSRFTASRTNAFVDVTAGATAHVVIGGPKGGGIRVHGRVSAAGAPATSVRVGAMGLASTTGVPPETETDSSGRFELRLDEPDRYAFDIALPDQRMWLSFQKWISEEGDVSLDLTLPEGTVRGVARSVGDRPLAGIWVALSAVEGSSKAEGWLGEGSTVTDEHGSFSFTHVPGGAYTLTGNPVQRGTGGREEPKPMDLILKEGAKIEDIVLRVP